MENTNQEIQYFKHLYAILYTTYTIKTENIQEFCMIIPVG